MCGLATKAPALEVGVMNCLCHKSDCKRDTQGDWAEEDRLVSKHHGNDDEAEEPQGKAEAV